MYQLFNEFADRYDLHTPPGHYRHDHALVIREALRAQPTHCRLLDVGCGTGVFLEAALAAGIDGYGLDASKRMIDCARRRLPNNRLRVQRMQEITDDSAYDVVCSLSWTIHYCKSETELYDVVVRCRNALRSRGLLVLQVADDRQMRGAVQIDQEPGPSGEPNDTLLIHRFQPRHDNTHTVYADYVYVSLASGELLSERHQLNLAHPSLVASALQRAGLSEIRLINEGTLSPFVTGVKTMKSAPSQTPDRP